MLLRRKARANPCVPRVAHPAHLRTSPPYTYALSPLPSPHTHTPDLTSSPDKHTPAAAQEWQHFAERERCRRQALEERVGALQGRLAEMQPWMADVRCWAAQQVRCGDTATRQAPLRLFQGTATRKLNISTPNAKV